MSNEMAIVLINMKPDAEGITESLNAIEGVKEVHGLYGIYDIIVFVEAESMSALKDIINTKIRRLGDINATLTMIVG
ncbi:Lrp/AsnC ligand binding domain-containing protein [Candidatus Bathyarchaeota archaeon]|nr:Lrp/AsnC ligand binding domain-containing protein [Candidatus Bathyarchaeota archaeon]MBT4320909.1 Lrp/AsnC ligand binding domain-containing protein [Candidatus Bathyarchaeota archaeon]MBT4423182.1 Lrp/AsnC ligand binding domain-containing protein [Candidatus Bathyarchaeota archaeon]MBT5643082.1 Lrp/AsnC ligand binding domain-containing protein [Candidatus Bathyarchaeota archaeon]MBT6605955.1 Lrp/AsnC ligand binding domain-containing protein [Candidatus Bathyarchaeota archaeon]